MASLEVFHFVAAPPKAVWAVVIDLNNWAETIEAIESVERLDGGDEFGVGTKWREVRTMFGKQATEEMEVIEYEEGSRYSTFAESHGSKYFSEISVVATDDGSKLSMGFRGEPQSLIAKIMDKTLTPLFMGATRKALAKDLADIAVLAEKTN